MGTWRGYAQTQKSRDLKGLEQTLTSYSALRTVLRTLNALTHSSLTFITHFKVDTFTIPLYRWKILQPKMAWTKSVRGRI